MATRSLIGFEDKYIYCHWDGYLKHNGEILKKYYTNPHKIRYLLSLGDISVLRPCIDPLPSIEHTFDNSNKEVTVFYHRDRGEPYENVKAKDIGDTFFNFGHGVDYIYMFTNDKWFYKESEDSPWKEV